ncbi:MAG: glycosyltransferase [Clostridia bacterium]|nr:glycosyltransferase [Clostridia bacterium]
MRVVEVISDTNIGGAGVLLCNRLRHKSEDIETVVVLPSGSKLIPRLKALGVLTVQIKGCCDRSFDPKAIPELIAILKSLKPDIVNSHGCASARVAARLSGARVSVYTRHCCFPIKRIYEQRLTRSLTAFTSKLTCDAVIAVSPAVKRDLALMGVPRSMVKVIVNGAEPLRLLNAEERAAKRRELSIPEGATVVGIFARLEECKDHETFLKAARELCDRGGEYRFLIVGTGSAEAHLKRLCKDLGLEKKVVFTGFVEDISSLMSITDINVNCSVGTETSSLALSEGMSLGVPAVVSDFGGNCYMVKDGVNGFVYPQRDRIALADAIIRLSDKKLYTKLSKNSLERFERELNAERMSAETAEFYRQLYLLISKQKNG